MLTRKRFVPPLLSGKWEVDGERQMRAILNYLLSLEDKGSLAIRWEDIDGFRETVNVRDWGAKGDNSTNDAAAINRAIAKANAVSGPVALVFPPGQYKITADLSQITRGSIAVIGDGATIYVEGAGTAGFEFFNASPISYITVRGFVITSATQGGQGIKFQNCQHCSVADVTITDQVDGIICNNVGYVLLDNVAINLCTTGLTVTNESFGVQYLNGHINGGDGATYEAGTRGIKLVEASGCIFDGIDITRCEYGIACEPTAGGSVGVTWCFISNVEMDTSKRGLYCVKGTGAAIWGLLFTNCWFSTSDEYGIYLDKAVGVTFSNCIIFNNKSWGAFLNECRMVRFTGCMIDKNNVNGTAGVGGIYEEDSTYLMIDGNTFSNDTNAVAWSAGGGDQKVGFEHATSGDHINVVDNHFISHTTLDIKFSHTPASGRIRGNTTTRSGSVASAATITPELVHDVVRITGTTTVTQYGAVMLANRELTFIMDEACTIQHGNAWSLSHGEDFVAAAGDVLTAIVDGSLSKVKETSRSLPCRNATFTPGISFGGGTTGITYSVQTGSYSRQGNWVHCNGVILLTNKGSSTGAAKITGLPFACRNSNDSRAPVALYFANMSYANMAIAQTDVNATTIELAEVTEAGAFTTLNDTNFANNTQVDFSVTYRIS